jgi:hypothetical protein
MSTVVGQPTLQQQSAAGAGQGAANPWAVYGLNADGTPIAQPETKPDANAETATLQAKIADLEAKLAKIPEGFEGLSKKIALVDRVVAALKGDAPQQDPKTREIWTDLKDVARQSAPGVAKLLDVLEQDPQYFEKLGSANQALMAQHVIGLNEKAHTRVLELASKAGFKGADAGETEKMVFPFEQSITMVINANPEMRQAFLSGNIGVVDEVFNEMIKPHVSQRLREKSARLAKSTVPGAVPRGAAQPGQGVGEGQPAKRDISTPQGRADFHRQAVGRWLDKASAGRDDA